jgi:hypothetical protein
MNPGVARAAREESKLAAYLAQNTAPSDYVLVWGVSGPGIIHFESRRRSPTRFVTAYPFTRRGPDSALTRRWRTEFIRAIKQRPPAYVVLISGDAFPAINNADSKEAFRRFSRLRQFVTSSYRRVAHMRGRFQYAIWIRRDAEEAAPEIPAPQGGAVP